jgi:hypothetical protein
MLDLLVLPNIPLGQHANFVIGHSLLSNGTLVDYLLVLMPMDMSTFIDRSSLDDTLNIAQGSNRSTFHSNATAARSAPLYLVGQKNIGT